MSSLSSRLLLAVMLLLLVFFGATIIVLDSAFREAGEQAERDILDGQLIALLAAADPNENGELEMPPVMPEPRLAPGYMPSCAKTRVKGSGDLSRRSAWTFPSVHHRSRGRRCSNACPWTTERR